jgi:hypothetical protein
MEHEEEDSMMLEMYGRLSENPHNLGSRLEPMTGEDDEFMQIPLREPFLGTTISSHERETPKENDNQDDDEGFSNKMNIRKSAPYDNFTTIGK